MTRPSDAHWGLLTERSERIVRACIDVMHTVKQPYVLGGGWAVFAHAPSTPSVDCDIYVDGPLRPEAHQLLAEKGFSVGSRKEIETLELEKPSELLGTGDEDLGIPHVSFTPARLFDGRVHSVDLRLDPPLHNVPVPDRPSLAIAKMAALRGRTIGYLLSEDGAVRALLDPSTATMMSSMAQGYYLRKAGKDLYDVTVLLPDDDDRDAVRRVADEFGLWDDLTELLTKTPRPVRALAIDMAARVDAPSPAEFLQWATS